MEKYLNVQYIESITVEEHREVSYLSDYDFVPGKSKKPSLYNRLFKGVKSEYVSAYFQGKSFLHGNLSMKQVEAALEHDADKGYYTDDLLSSHAQTRPTFWLKDRVKIKMRSGEVNVKCFESEDELREFLADKRIQGVLTLIS